MSDNFQAIPYHLPCAYQELHEFYQPGNQHKVLLRPVGTAYLALFENRDGYTSQMDPKSGLFCYAACDEKGKMISTGIPITEPVPEGLANHLRPSSDCIVKQRTAAKQHFEESQVAQRTALKVEPTPGTEHTFGPNNGLLEGPQCVNGDVLGLTVLVSFKDNKVSNTIKLEDVDALLNGENYKENGNFCSVHEFFKTVSNGQLNYKNRIIGPIELDHNQNYYLQVNMVPEVTQKLVRQLGNLSEFDYQQRKQVAALNILYAGPSVFSGDLWPHNFFISDSPQDANGVGFYYYLLTGLGQSKDELRIGTICHENGHLLCRFPDIYDYGNRDSDSIQSEGIGSYCLMGAGNHNNEGRTPCPPNAHFRSLVGWCTRTPIRPGDLTLMPHDFSTCFSWQINANESFVLENRCAIDLNRYLPSEGLAIFHCDILGSNEWQGGTKNRHYQVALIQADGRLDLEKNRNRGDRFDLFRPGQSVNDGMQQPNTRCWDGEPSGLSVDNIRISGEGTITVRINAPQDPNVQAIVQESNKVIAIPDNYAPGISDVLTINESGRIEMVEVSVRISHSYRGDLRVSLRHGNDGFIVASPERNDARADIMVTSLDVTQGFQGGDAKGPWTLLVSDTGVKDIGKLVYWKLKVRLAGVAADKA